MPETKRSGKITYFIILILIVAGVSIWQFYNYKIANKSIHKLVTQKSKGLYNIHYTHFLIDEVVGSLSQIA
jgi:hypothetical protein